MCIIKKEIASSCLIILMCFALAACTHEDVPSVDVTSSTSGSIGSLPQGETGAGQVLPEDTSTSVIKTEIIDFIVPASVSDCMKHVEVVQDGVIMEVFYAVHEDLEKEAFRILFSKKESKDDIGAFKMEDEYLYVTVSANSYMDDDFEDDIMVEKYYTVVSSLSDVLNSLQADGRFCEKDEIEMEKVNHSLEYWNIVLPAQMQWEESTENGYAATFYFARGGERIALYSIRIGERVLKSEIGFYYLDDKWQRISMESYALPDTDGWSEGEITELYTMMSSINDVLQAIMSSENFSEEVSNG